MKIALYLDHDYFNDEDEDFKDIIKLAIDDFKMDKVIIVLSMNNELDINFQWQIISNIVFDYSSKNNYCVGISFNVFSSVSINTSSLQYLFFKACNVAYL